VNVDKGRLEAMIEPQSPTWRGIKGLVDHELLIARGKLEAQGLSHDETEGIRGYILALRKVLDMGLQPK